MSITIRPASLEDAGKIADFQVAMAWETEEKKLDPQLVNTAVRTVFADTSKGFYLVGDADGEVVSSLLITYEWSDWRNCDMWYIQSVYVASQFRGQGAFKKMYQRVLDLAQEQGAAYVRLYVEVDNEKAQKAYESLGMKRMPYYMYDVKT
jgi:ribosomal protein S18 acetylase RimI-like enzyme